MSGIGRHLRDVSRDFIADTFHLSGKNGTSQWNRYAVYIWSVKCSCSLVQSKASIVQTLLGSSSLRNTQLWRPNGTYLRIVFSSSVRCNESLENTTLVVSSALQEFACQEGL